MILRYAVLPFALLACLPSLALAARGFEARDLATMDRYSSPTLSPDGATLVYARRVVDFDANKAASALWSVPASGGKATRLTPEGWNVNSPAFAPDGKTVYFLSAKNGSSQLYAVPVAGGKPVQRTQTALDVDAYKLSPDGRQVALAIAVFADCQADLACSKRKLAAKESNKASGVLYDRLFVRHWDTWSDGRLNRVFVAPLAGAAPIRNAALVSGFLAADVPAKPFGDLSDLAWSPDGTQLAISVRKSDREEPWSTNFDIWLVSADGKAQPRNLTETNKAWDAGPVFAPDGGRLYYRAMKRAGFEADRFALMEMDLASGRTREIAPDWDRSADGITLSADGRTIYTQAQDIGEHPLFAVDVASGEVKKLIGEGSVSALDVAGSTLAFARNSMTSGDQLFVADLSGAAPRALTPSAQEMVKDARFGDYEQFQFKGADNATVYGYVVKPWNYQPGRKYPVAFLIHGGPQGSFGNGWSYRWNPQTYAGQGYAVVMIDFHGSTGYGQAFTDAISGDWGGKPLRDLQKGWAAAQETYDFLDGGRACALGASYGGYMTNWIAGNWFDRNGNAPFKCLVTHNGVFDTRSMGLVTEELWFTEWEFGGTVWEKPEAYERFNPARHVHKWKTPTLIVGGQNDFRVPIDQSLSAFTALQRRGIESQLLYFPDENHWVLKPQNSVQWHQTVNAWLARWTAPQKAQ